MFKAAVDRGSERSSDRPRCKVFVFDDGSVIARGMIVGLNACDLIDVVGTAHGRPRAVDLVREARPHAVITTTHRDTLALVTEMREAVGDTVAVLTIGEPGPLVIDLLSTGAVATLPWQVSVEQLSREIIAAVQQSRFRSSTVDQLAKSMRRTGPDAVRLSRREIQVLRRAAAGQTNSRVARELSLSEATVKTYWQRIFKKLEVNDRTTAVTMAMTRGMPMMRCGCGSPVPRPMTLVAGAS
ncbi:response regulator transcription factor [Saccharomonospora sp. NPDC046836]|uniref:response regulator transcription factor n=1 Tax=Saccharomonospora sp. NPDC046836 TaxID=3156921 RepID=UPI0033D7959A